MTIYNDKGLANEECKPEITKEKRPRLIFEGSWQYYLDDIYKWLSKKPHVMYLDVGRGFFVLPLDVKEFLKKNLINND